MLFFRLKISLIFLTIVCWSCDRLVTDGNISAVITIASKCKGTSANSFINLASAETGKSAGVLYNYNPELEELSITHLNAAINCCRVAIITRSVISKDTIIITQGEKGDACKCLCLIDIDMTVKRVKRGSYILKIEELYLGDQAKIVFPINLDQTPYGSFFVQRTSYPW